MLIAKMRLEFDDNIIPDRIDEAAESVLPIGARRIEKRAKDSIHPARPLLLSEVPKHRQKFVKRSKKQPYSHSEPGRPPLTPSGTLPSLITSAQDGPVALIGPRKKDGRGFPAGRALEFGRSYSLLGRRITIEPRPFMGPALKAVLPTLAADFKDSIRE